MPHPNPHDIIKEEQESYVKEKLPPPDGGLPVDVRVLYEALRTHIFASGLYIGKLLEELGLHDRSTYCRFNLHFGRTPKDFVIFHRMQLAKRLLSISSLSISSIALSIGYDRPHAFSQTFKRRTGYAPSVYRGGAKVMTKVRKLVTSYMRHMVGMKGTLPTVRTILSLNH